jgi:hypothetical protein
MPAMIFVFVGTDGRPATAAFIASFGIQCPAVGTAIIHVAGKPLCNYEGDPQNYCRQQEIQQRLLHEKLF